MKKYSLLIISLVLLNNVFGQSNPKYDKWKTNSYFRGYNILFESVHTYRDFIDFKNYGGNLFQIGVFGWQSEDAPYSIQQNNIDSTDKFVHYCRQAGIYYILAVRSGPGAYDTYQESQGNTGESRIWNFGNTTEQQQYANMLKSMVSRYEGDSLFAGINLVVEPRPKVRYIPTNISSTYKYFLEHLFNIHMDQVYQFFVSQIRTVDAKIPVLIENFAYSTPELFPAYTINDPYVVYSAHNYMPKEYTNDTAQYSLTYPGNFWSLTFLAKVFYDSTLLRNTVFSQVRAFQTETNAPVIIGELGVMYPQKGANIYLGDIFKIAMSYGWHWAIWDWRRSSGKEWNIENFGNAPQPSYNYAWNTVLSYFNAPPVPQPVFPADSSVVNDTVITFSFDSLTSYTTYDVEIYDSHGNLQSSVDNLSESHWNYSGNQLINGSSYSWRVRAKNPGGNTWSNSSWSRLYSFSIPLLVPVKNVNNYPKQFILYNNYPNPFNPATTIMFNIPVISKVSLVVYDINGRKVASLLDNNYNAGEYKIHFDGENLSSGVYFYKLTATAVNGESNFISVKRMVLLK